jgi:G3E family GTPase
LCCSIKDLGVAAIEKLMQKKGAFDHILLETTGLADPGLFFLSLGFLLCLTILLGLGPIASMFWHNEEFAAGLGRDITLDGVICVVDAVFGKQVRFFFPRTLISEIQRISRFALANGRGPQQRRCQHWRKLTVRTLFHNNIQGVATQ